MQLYTISHTLTAEGVTFHQAELIDLERLVFPHVRRFQLNGVPALIGWIFPEEDAIVLVCQTPDDPEHLEGFVLAGETYERLWNDADLPPEAQHLLQPHPQRGRERAIFDKGVQDGALLDAWSTRQAKQPPDLTIIDSTGLAPTNPIFASLPVDFCFRSHP
jgi:hypothetical protein